VASCLAGWLNQGVSPTELLVLDDESTDDTLMRLHAALAGVPWASVLAGASKPSGWSGKSFACHQLAQAARGDVLVFADADVVPGPDTLEALLGLFARPETHAVAVLPRHTASSMIGRHVAPLQTWVLLCFCPLWLNSRRPRATLSAANGQLFLVRRRAYDMAGGHRAVAGSLAEDTAFGRRLAACGFETTLVDGTRLVTCASYESFPEMWFGHAKNLFAVLFHSRVLATSAVLALVLGWVLPWCLLVAFMARGEAAPALPLAEIGLGLATRLVVSRRFGYSVLNIWSQPLLALLLGALIGNSVWAYRRGSVRWRGREYHLAEPTGGSASLWLRPDGVMNATSAACRPAPVHKVPHPAAEPAGSREPPPD
jgi:GT2 family glycosyltransferase